MVSTIDIFGLFGDTKLYVWIITGPPNGPVLFCLLASVVVVVCQGL